MPQARIALELWTKGNSERAEKGCFAIAVVAAPVVAAAALEIAAAVVAVAVVAGFDTAVAAVAVVVAGIDDTAVAVTELDLLLAAAEADQAGYPHLFLCLTRSPWWQSGEGLSRAIVPHGQ